MDKFNLFSTRESEWSMAEWVLFAIEFPFWLFIGVVALMLSAALLGFDITAHQENLDRRTTRLSDRAHRCQEGKRMSETKCSELGRNTETSGRRTCWTCTTAN